MLKITQFSIIFCFILYIFSGIFGFLLYGDNLNDTILNEFLTEIQDEKSDLTIKILLIISNVGFLLCAITSIPLIYYTLKQNFFSTYKFILKIKKKKNIEMENEDENNKITNEKSLEINNGENIDTNSEITNNTESETEIETERTNSESSENNKDKKKIRINLTKKEEIIISVILYITIGCITILIPKLKSMFNIVGSTAANSIQFIIPCLMIICLKEKSEKLINLILVKILLIFGIVSLIICLVAEFVNAFI